MTVLEDSRLYFYIELPVHSVGGLHFVVDDAHGVREVENMRYWTASCP